MTKKLVTEVDVVDGEFIPSIEKDFLKMAVVERHHHLNTIGLGIVHGFGLKSGAVATTIAHDSHNAIVVGTNDPDMLKALSTLQEMQGGLVVVKDGTVLAAIDLPVGGIMTHERAEAVLPKLNGLHDALHVIHPNLTFHLFLTLSFLALPVIPEIKLTDTGLFDVTTFQHILIEAN